MGNIETYEDHIIREFKRVKKSEKRDYLVR